MNTSQRSNLVWFDTEYTTLELEQARLIQVAMVVTDMDGRRIAPPEQDLVTSVRIPMDFPVSDFVAKECPELVRAARSDAAPEVEAVDCMLAQRLDAIVGPPAKKAKDRPMLAGNTIHADWWFARKVFPSFMSRLFYRNLDVSSLKILWLDSKLGPEFDKENPAMILDYLPGYTLPPGAKKHDALYDVLCSIAELNYYRRNFIKGPC